MGCNGEWVRDRGRVSSLPSQFSFDFPDLKGGVGRRQSNSLTIHVTDKPIATSLTVDVQPSVPENGIYPADPPASEEEHANVFDNLLAQNYREATFEDLPPDVIGIIASKLDGKSLLSLMFTSPAIRTSVEETCERISFGDEGGLSLSIRPKSFAQAISPLQRLKHINVSSCRFLSDDALVVLPHGLETFEADKCSWVGDRGLDILASRVALTLKKLSLNWCRNITHKGCVSIAQCSKLESLSITHGRITDDGFISLFPATSKAVSFLPSARRGRNCGGWQSLRKLDLSYNTAITDKCLQVASRSLNFQGIEDLSLEGCFRLTDQGLITALSKFTNLSHLNVSHCDLLTDTALLYLSSWEFMSQFQPPGTSSTDEEGEGVDGPEEGNGEWPFTPVAAVGVEMLQRTPRHTASCEGKWCNATRTLTSLNISSCSTLITDVGVGSLCKMFHLKHLFLSKLKQPSSWSLGPLLQSHRGLETLHLFQNTNVEANLLPPLSLLANLSELDIRGCSLDGDRLFSTLSRIPKLRHLSVTASTVTEVGYNDLKSVDSLSSLALESIALSDGSLALRRFLKRLRRIRKLRLSDSRHVGDKTVRFLGALKSLTTLSLEHTAVTHEGLTELSALPELNCLDLTGCDDLDKDELESVIPLLDSLSQVVL